MILKCLGSGSHGNCWLLMNDKECLILDAGIAMKEVKVALNFNLKKIAGVCVTHSHLDHSLTARAFEKMGISVFKPYESEMSRQVRTYGGFVIRSFDLEHNGVPCHGFQVTHDDIGKLLYVTDTEYVRWSFKKLEVEHIIVEANYAAPFIDQTIPNYEHKLRGHQSLDAACLFLCHNNSHQLKNVILAHLGAESSDSDYFISEVQKVVNCPVYIGRKGLVVGLKKTDCPF